jgi:hypothetical protein
MRSFRQLGESSIEFVVGSGMNDASCTTQRARRSLHLLDLVGKVDVIRLDKDTNLGIFGNDLVQHL